jgi:hypothetical protein
MSPDAVPRVIGWKEYVEFPDWGLRRVRAKIDTGARTSALGVAGYDVQESPDGGLVAVLRLATSRRHPERVAVIRADVLRTIVVRNSGGVKEHRPLVETRIKLGPVTKVVRLTITYRSGMLCPMILGRQALAGEFIVDVSRKYVLRAT